MKEQFNVSCVTYLTDEDLYKNGGYHHWSKGLTMFITKNGVTISLNQEEIKELVKSLPRTIGGKY